MTANTENGDLVTVNMTVGRSEGWLQTRPTEGTHRGGGEGVGGPLTVKALAQGEN